MTVIVGLEDPAVSGKAWIGADSQATSDHRTDVRADPKLFAREEHGERWVFGFTTSYRFGQLLRYELKIPTELSLDAGGYPEGDEVEFAGIVRILVPAMREVLKDGGYAKVEHNQEEGGCVMVAWRHRIYLIDSDFQVARSATGMNAIGAGGREARATLVATQGLRYAGDGLTAEDRIFRAVETACMLNSACGPPILVYST